MKLPMTHSNIELSAGPRCETHTTGCPVCDSWAEYDAIRSLAHTAAAQFLLNLTPDEFAFVYSNSMPFQLALCEAGRHLTSTTSRTACASLIVNEIDVTEMSRIMSLVHTMPMAPAVVRSCA